jgi:3-methyladenine DNA glycosylase/8-oxoguanine DNA glycosylase
MPQRVLSLKGALDLSATFGAMASKAAGRVHSGRDEVWWVTNTVGGPASLHVRASGGEVRGEAWGRGATWVLERLAELCGLSDDPSQFAPPPGLVRDVHRRNPGLRLGATGRVFELLVPVILGQRVTSVEAKRSYRRLLDTFGTAAPGPIKAMVPPDAATLARLSYADLHPLGVERSRAQIIIEVARRAARLEEIVDMPLPEAYVRLTAVRGVGDWTAAIVMGGSLGDPDAVPIGDYHLPNMVAWALAREPRGTDERMLELLEPYAGHRRRVLILLKSAGIHAPRYGPKMGLRDFSRS